MNRLSIALLAAIPAIALASCADTYGGRSSLYVRIPYAYDGYYDDHYGAIYDGYWGRDGGFYYRNDEGERVYRRGDGAHFQRRAPPSGNFHQMQGAMTPRHGIKTPHFEHSGRRGN
jgi:hypothetical protein